LGQLRLCPSDLLGQLRLCPSGPLRPCCRLDQSGPLVPMPLCHRSVRLGHCFRLYQLAQ